MKAENTYLITMQTFGVRKGDSGKELVHHHSIINYGEDIGNHQVKYLTKDGVQIRSIFEFENSIKIFKLKDICLENLMSSWKKQNKEHKPIVLDENIETNEVFENNYSPLKIMVDRRKDCIAIKPIFDAL